jgi:dimethylaniline monooxygenase (N-oxide forming)
MEVCIIGGSFYGVGVAKVSKYNGLIPFILEKGTRAGGIWRGVPGEVGVWDSLKTNTSKYSMAYSDHPFKPEVQDFPLAADVLEYLEEYISKHELLQYFNFGCKVVEVSRSDEDYLVKWVQAGETKEKIFKYVVVASGHNSKEYFPYENEELFKGTVIRSGSYREPSIFKDKKVVTIGRSFSGSEMAYEASTVSSDVTQICRKPRAVVGLFYNGLPYDMIPYSSYIFSMPTSLLYNPGETLMMNRLMLNLTGDTSVPEDILDTQIMALVAKDGYVEAVTDKKIKLVSGNVKGFYSDGVVLADGTKIEADIVATGAGYITTFDYFSDEIKQILQYDDTDHLLSTITYRGILHPSLPRLAFVGNITNAAPCKYDLQAEVAVRYLLGTLEVTQDEMWQGVRDEEWLRTLKGVIYFPYTFTNHIKELMRILKIDPRHTYIQRELKFKYGMYLPHFLFPERPGQLEIATKVIEEIRQKYPNAKQLFG